MEKYIKRHVNWMKDKEDWTQEELDYFLNIIVYLQHERFIHLVITIVTAVLFFISAMAMIFIDSIITALIFAVFTILLVFYIRYYCFMENSIQSMYYKYTKLRGYVPD